jgi:G3E family GTPase
VLFRSRQVGFADRLLLSKCDIADPDVIAGLSERLNCINPRALQQRLKHGCAEPGSLLGIGGFNLDASLLAVEANGRSAGRFIPLATSATALGWSRRQAAHDDEISSFLLDAGEVELDRIGAFVQSMVDEFGEQLLRYKGILAIANEDRRLIFQGVQRVCGFDYGEPWAHDEARISRIVVIGKRLPKPRLRDAFLRAAGIAYHNYDGA